MATAIKYSALGTFSTAIAGASSAPTLKNLSSGSRKLGDAIDRTGSGNREQESQWVLLCRGASTVSSGGYIELYFIKAVDGTNYEDGDDSTDPPLTALAGIFPLRAVSTAQRVSLDGIPLPNCPFKPLIKNSSGVGLTNTDNENVLSYRTYDPNEIQ